VAVDQEDLVLSSYPFGPMIGRNKIWIISKLVDRIFYESLARARKERQIAPQASAGYCFS
jgi:hypothetical protein